MKFFAVFTALLTLGAGGFQNAPSIHSFVFASGLQSLVGFVADPGDAAVFYAVEQTGRIRVVRHRVVAEDFLDLRGRVLAGGERGLLGLAFAPDFTSSGRFFVNFIDTNGNTVVARFRRGTGGVADPASRFDLKWGPERAPVITQPAFPNHKGGHLAFGPDGFLYIGTGDGGSGDDPLNHAQTPSSLLGKMLRIDVAVADSHPNGYVVPSDNPFVGGTPAGVRPEIWAFGFRNPWRYSFDDVSLGGTGAMVIGDVGQNAREEIDYEPRGRGGRNYGWRMREGAAPNPNTSVQNTPAALLPLTDPIFDYGRSQGASVSAGYVYRGRSLGATNRGRYFFADFVSGRVWSLGLTITGSGDASAGGLVEHTTALGGPSQLGNISGFGVDRAGELFILSYSRGVVLQLVGQPGAPTNLRIIR